MHMTAADLAFMKGEASANRMDSSADQWEAASRYGYSLPGPQRDAFVAGYQATREAMLGSSGSVRTDMGAQDA